MTGEGTSLLYVGGGAVADAAASVDGVSVRTVEEADAARAALDRTARSLVVVEQGVAGWPALLRDVTGDGSPPALFVTLDGEGVDRAVEAGATDYVRADAPPTVVRRRVRSAVEDRELDRYRTLVETVGDAMYMLDADGRITMANEAMAEALGCDRATLVGSHATEFMPEEDYERGTELLRSLAADDGRDRDTYEMWSVGAGDATTPTENNVALLTDESGAVEGSVGVIRDITERKRRTETLERQNERLDEFASTVTHDLRNPLNVIDGHLELAREDDDPHHLDVIEREVERIDELLADLRRLARQGKVVSEPDPVSLTDVAADAWNGVPTADAAIDLPNRDPTVRADRTRLRQLLENLFRNAVEHGAAASDADVRGDGGTDGVTVRVGATDGGFFVADDGRGIPATERERIFDRGYTTADDGTGLGLKIVRRIAAGHGWTVEAGESDDGGARFEFRTAVTPD
ncbi:two-component system sensor histidine kinase NtrB [Halostella litorea]|uniref:two-component system sensor histidine kinase NtrB n=1 Tax=Halostella litorea TaxID=2528831 RepID=UPI001091BBFB|nr:PAS domain-containing sensor histidine kinase [Halostella litorea]